MRTVICVCVGAVLTTELLSVNITIRAVQRSSRRGGRGGLGKGGERNGEARGQRQRKGFSHALLLSRFGRRQLNKALRGKSEPIHCHYSWPGSMCWQKKVFPLHKRDSRRLADQGGGTRGTREEKKRRGEEEEESDEG